MRGRKLHLEIAGRNKEFAIKKESPNEGTETLFPLLILQGLQQLIKKESPNEGTETRTVKPRNQFAYNGDKKRIPE